MSEDKKAIAFVQEPYTQLNNVAGFPKHLKVFAHDDNRKRAAVIVNNNDIDGIVISQLADDDCIVIEFTYKNVTFYGASMYCDSDQEIGDDIENMEKIITLSKGKGLIISADTNARSKLWFDK